MRKAKENKGITLIALVITVIVLLILAAISIATLTGENGVLTKASKAGKDTDIVDTKEQIKLEIMGNLKEQNTSYTNDDVIAAVRKITGKDVVAYTTSVESKKGNKVDIQDLWNTVIYIKPFYYISTDIVEVPYSKGQVWTKEYIMSLPAETEINMMHDVWGSTFGTEIQFNADGYAFPYLYLDGTIVKFGDPLVAGGVYYTDL